LGKTAEAFGIGMEDMGGAYAAMLNAGIKPGEEMKQNLMDLVDLGIRGQINFKDFAEVLPQLAGMGSMMHEGGAGMVKTMASLEQIAAGPLGGNKDEARTAVAHSMMELGSKSDVLKKSGIDVHAKGGGMKDPAQTIGEVIAAAFGKGGKGIGVGANKSTQEAALSDVFGARGMMLGVGMISQLKNSGFDVHGAKKEDIVSHVVKLVDELRKGSGMTVERRNEAVRTVEETPAHKFAVAMEDFKAKIGELLPEITALLPTVTKLMQSFAELAVDVGKNPVKGVGAIIGLSIGKEILAAGVGKILQESLAGSLSKAGSAGLILGAGTVITVAGIAFLKSTSESGRAAGSAYFKQVTDEQNTTRQLKYYADLKDLTPEQNTKKEELLKHAKELMSSAGAVSTVYNRERNSWNPLESKGAEEGAAGTTPQDFAAALTALAAVAEKLGVAGATLQAAGTTMQAAGTLSNPNAPGRGNEFGMNFGH
jgi:hypothetical protein